MKKIIASTLILFILATSCAVGTSEVRQSKENHFPHVSGMNLHGAEKHFPDCFTNEKTIAIVAYQRWQQEWVDEWYAAIKEQQQITPQLAYYEVPTISKLTGPVRWWIYKGMQGGIQDETMRSSVITLHIDKEPFNKHLGITDEEIVHVFVLDPNGKILARSEGRFDKARWDKLLKEIQ